MSLASHTCQLHSQYNCQAVYSRPKLLKLRPISATSVSLWFLPYRPLPIEYPLGVYSLLEYPLMDYPLMDCLLMDRLLMDCLLMDCLLFIEYSLVEYPLVDYPHANRVDYPLSPHDNVNRQILSNSPVAHLYKTAAYSSFGCTSRNSCFLRLLRRLTCDSLCDVIMLRRWHVMRP